MEYTDLLAKFLPPEDYKRMVSTAPEVKRRALQELVARMIAGEEFALPIWDPHGECFYRFDQSVFAELVDSDSEMLSLYAFKPDGSNPFIAYVSAEYAASLLTSDIGVSLETVSILDYTMNFKGSEVNDYHEGLTAILKESGDYTGLSNLLPKIRTTVRDFSEYSSVILELLTPSYDEVTRAPKNGISELTNRTGFSLWLQSILPSYEWGTPLITQFLSLSRDAFYQFGEVIKSAINAIAGAIGFVGRKVINFFSDPWVARSEYDSPRIDLIDNGYISLATIPNDLTNRLVALTGLSTASDLIFPSIGAYFSVTLNGDGTSEFGMWRRLSTAKAIVDDTTSKYSLYYILSKGISLREKVESPSLRGQELMHPVEYALESSNGLTAAANLKFGGILEANNHLLFAGLCCSLCSNRIEDYATTPGKPTFDNAFNFIPLGSAENYGASRESLLLAATQVRDNAVYVSSTIINLLTSYVTGLEAGVNPVTFFINYDTIKGQVLLVDDALLLSQTTAKVKTVATIAAVTAATVLAIKTYGALISLRGATSLDLSRAMVSASSTPKQVRALRRKLGLLNAAVGAPAALISSIPAVADMLIPDGGNNEADLSAVIKLIKGAE